MNTHVNDFRPHKESPFRKRIADEIDRLIVLLDSIDRDPDLEDNGDLERDIDLDESDGDINDETCTWPERHTARNVIIGADEQEDDEDSGDLEDSHDREFDHAEAGIADADALHALEPVGPVRSSPIRSNRALGFDPELLPNVFALVCEGDCMSPVYPDGTKLKFDRTKSYGFGDTVMIVRRPGSYPPGDHQALVKQFVSDTRGIDLNGGEGGIVAKMLNPPKILFFPKSDVLAVIKCVGVADPNEVGPKLTAGQLLARKAQEMAAPMFGPEPGSLFLRTERHG
jgi:hypothetical protein